MGELFKLKKWLTLEETAKRLSNSLSKPVSVADVLQLSLDEHLTVSVNTPLPCDVRVWKGEQADLAQASEPTKIVGVYDLLLDVGGGAEELIYRLKVLRNGKAKKLDKSAVYVLGENRFCYEFPVNYNLEIVVCKSAISELESCVIETERKKAVAQIKASRTTASVSVNDLLENTITGLIEETIPEDDFTQYFN